MALERYRVTMRNVAANASGGHDLHEAIDHVDSEHLDAYVADAKTRWQAVIVSDEIDHGPGGEDGDYTVHAHMLKKD